VSIRERPTQPGEIPLRSQEYFLVFLSLRSGVLPRFLASRFGLALSLGAFSVASAQTAPQLLPYTVKAIAGGGTKAIAAGSACPVSGFTATDAYGDGCLATEINIAPTSTSGTGPRYAIADSTGAVFFSDATNGLVRRIDPVTGIVTAVAGGKSSSPGVGVACGSGVSTDSDGDGCPANLVKLSHPMGLAFDVQGNLYFADNGYDNVRRIAATAGFITTTGIITNIAGGTTYGYNVNNTSASGPVNAATQSYLNFPYDVAFDKAGNLYIADEGNNAIEAINMQATTQTIQGLSIPAGTIAKIAGYGSLAAKSASSGDCPDFVSTSSRGGCYFGKWTDGAFAASSNNDGVYSVALDSNNNLFFSNEFNDNVGMITPANVISTYAGIQGSPAKKIQRGVAGSFGIGSVFGVTIDANNNLYTADASSGLIWRVDAGTRNMYVVGGGATTVCSTATDTYGDGCPATQATFGSSSGTGNFASTTLPGPGVFGVKVDPYSDLFLGDTETGLIREIASGTQFGVVGANQPTDIVDIHFAVADGPAGTAPYTLSAGSSNFSVGTAKCTTNSDSTTDCLLPVTATPSVLGLFTGTLTVTSQLGATASFPLSGIYAQSPTTRTVVSYAATSVNCTGTSVYSTTTPIALTATLVANGPAPPTGTISFFANGTLLGTAQNVVNLGTTSNPLYGATLSNTFATPNTYVITATYSGDSYFTTSTSGSTTIVTSNPTFSTSAVTSQQSTISAGQTGLYSFNLAQNVYSGTITMACSGLPANASCSFSPTSIVANGCSTSSVVALSILTQQAAVSSSGAGIGLGGSGWLPPISLVAGFGLALLIGIRRRRAPLRFAQLWMALALLIGISGLSACGNATLGGPATPSGNYTVTVTATGSTGTTATFSVPLTIK
jgi:streptogramin lyase